jgi:hypothetical protein
VEETASDPNSKELQFAYTNVARILSDFSGSGAAGVGHLAMHRRAQGALGVQRVAFHLHGHLQRISPLRLPQHLHVSKKWTIKGAKLL